MKSLTALEKQVELSYMVLPETKVRIKQISMYTFPCSRKTLNSTTQANIKDKICAFNFFTQILSDKNPFLLLNDS